MKELSIEEKAHNYDEAIKRANELNYVSDRDSLQRKTVEHIFPELKESEDERIVKELLTFFRESIHGGHILTNKEYDSWIAWLEKQAEQKPADKIQLGKKYKCIASPRYTAFMTGEIYKPEDKFLCSLMNFCSDCFEPVEDGEQKPAEEYNITGIGSKNAQGKLGEMIKNLKSTDKVEPKFKISDWIIRSAENFEHNKYLITEIRDCYVCEDLKDRRVTFTFNDVHKNFKLWDISDAKDGDVLANSNISVFIYAEVLYNKPYAYCGVDKFGVFKDNCRKNGWSNSVDDIHPATKEQRDLLFQKMHEAGYEWDAEKKELKKIEQNHANVFNIYEKSLLKKFKQAVYDCAWGKVTCKEEGETQEEYAERWSEQFLLMVRDWADDYIDFTIQQELRNSYKKGKTDAIEKLHEQKPAWSEEDMAAVSRVISIVKWAAYSDHSHPILNDKGATELVERLKSLKDRYTWKPSDEQMKALADALNLAKNCGEEIAFDLRTLYEQLKKLN